MHKTSTTDLSVLMARIEQRPGEIERVVFNPGAFQVTATLGSLSINQTFNLTAGLAVELTIPEP